jgi:uroporphyrinogen decarboxylase
MGEMICDGARRYRDFYRMAPGAPIYQAEFGFYVADRWMREGYINDKTDLAEIFGFDPPGWFSLDNLGWCEAGFCPAFEEKVLLDDGEYEIVQDFAGRAVKCFKGRRSGFMPEYVGHPVKDMATWEANCLWRMDPKSPGRDAAIAEKAEAALAAEAEGRMVIANVVGGYKYLRSLMGPLELMYLLYDDPALIHACMAAWLGLADSVYARFQRHVSIDEVFFAEDICYNHGLLVSGGMVREFLFPYYQQLIANIRARQPDKSRKAHIHIDTDGFSDAAIPLYQEIGLDYLSPFEAASSCDVVRAGKEYPQLRISGGFDKRILAQGKDAIDREIERIMPVMKRRGGYFPTCDHGVAEEVCFEDYMHYRKRMLEYA